MFLISVRYEKDERNRQVVVYVDTDSMSDEDYVEYCRLMKLHDETIGTKECFDYCIKARKILDCLIGFYNYGYAIAK